MSERYEPASEFLKAIIAEKVPLSGSPLAEANLLKLIVMIRDEDRSNRDWATMLLSQEELDTPEIRAALLAAAEDVDDVVRAEALLGLALRDPQVALPLVRTALTGDHASVPVFEAAAIVAHPSLMEVLRPWTEPSDNSWLDQLAVDALAACEKALSAADRPSE